MLVLLIISMSFNLVTLACIYYLLANDKPAHQDKVIMQQQLRINELEFALSDVQADTYIDEIISE